MSAPLAYTLFRSPLTGALMVGRIVARSAGTVCAEVGEGERSAQFNLRSSKCLGRFSCAATANDALARLQLVDEQHLPGVRAAADTHDRLAQRYRAATNRALRESRA